MGTAKKMLKFLLIATVVAAVFFIVSNTYGILTSEFTSFPWWSALVFGAYYFGPALAIEGLALLGIHIWEKRKEKVN